MKKIGIFLVVILMLFSSACGGYQDISSIGAKDSISGERLNFRMRGKRAVLGGICTRFSIDKDIETLACTIAETDDTLVAEVYRDTFIVINTPATIFLIEQLPNIEEDKDDEYRYGFYAPTGVFNTGTDVSVYVPFYLLKNYPKYSSYDEEFHIENAYLFGYYQHGNGFSATKEWECESYGTTEEVYEFYNKLSCCEVTREEDTLLVTLISDNTPKNKTTISFSTSEGVSKAKFSVEKIK